MAIREQIRRVLRKSDSSDTISQTESKTNGIKSSGSSTHSSSSESSQQLKRPTSKPSRSWGFGRDVDGKDAAAKAATKSPKKSSSKDKKKSRKAWIHPSERPLTAQNLKHQEMFSQFTMTFGTSNLSQVEDLDYGGISPCCTRPGSLDLGPRSL